MKIYIARQSYFDGDHSHGIRESPPFTSRAEAERFLAALQGMAGRDLGNAKQWWWEGAYRPARAYITELDVLDKWEGPLLDRDEYLTIYYT